MRWRLRALRASGCIWASLFMLAGCSLYPAVNPSPELARQLPARTLLSATPFIEQADYQCGPASLAMVMNAYGRDLTVSQLTPWVFTPDAKGSFPAEMDAVARLQGFISYPVHNLDSLLRELDAGHPVLVLQNLGTDWYTRWHFAVVIGFDLERRELILRSGELPERRTGFTLFETTWQRSEHWARVIVPPEQMPATAELLPFLKAAVDLEQTGPRGAALTAYQFAAQLWPDQPLALMALANARMQLGQFEQARSGYERVLALQPDMAAAWNNYAYALQALACGESARKAAACATALQPGNSAFTETLLELGPATFNAAHCPAQSCPVLLP